MANKSKLTKRQLAIQELIKNHAIPDQAKLIELLANLYNIFTNQAAISRDLRKLGIHKRARGDIMVYELPEIDVVTEILSYAVKSVHHNESLVIINTIAGTADFVGDVLDKQQGLNILATLAGENVVFVAPVSIKNVEELSQNLSKLFKLKE